MAAAGLPPTLKSIGHYLKIANEHSNRDPVVYYWCLVHAVESGMKIENKSPETMQYLGQLLGTLEQVKQTLAGQEAITSDLVAQAHLEEYALRLFAKADAEDRRGIFNKNIVKMFYTAGHLMDCLETFGEMDERVAETRKYAKWKAAYIHSCLRQGITPQPGPAAQEGEGEDESSGETFVPPPQPGFTEDQAVLPPPQAAHAPPKPPPSSAVSAIPRDLATPTRPMGVSASAMASASKAARYAQSALEYEDVPTAVKHLQEALHLLTQQ